MRKVVNISNKMLGLTMLLALVGCSSVQDPSTEFQNQPAHEIFMGGEKALADRNYNTAVRHYEALDALFPFSPDQEQGLLDSIYAYYQDGDYASASAASARFIHDYPANPHVDYALYMKGSAEMIQDKSWPQRYFPVDTSSRDPGMARAAFEDFNRLIQTYPNSRYAPDARARMVYLRNMFAKKEVDIAEFYYNKKAYVAASNRASNVLMHYEQTPAEEKALYIMTKSYRHLNQNDEAQKSLETLQLNFPHSRYLRELK